MLKTAQLYNEGLNVKDMESWYDMDNIYCNTNPGTELISLSDNNYTRHSFASVDKDNDVIGFISYTVDWMSMSATNLCILSYKKGNIEFIRDTWKVVCDIFEKYNMNRLSWKCYADNPVIDSYRKFIKNHGGCECGYEHQVAKLMDGKLHDMVCFEIMANDFHK